MSLGQFVEDEQKTLIISEAAAKLAGLAPQLCPGIDGRDVRGIGNRLRHEYHGISVERLWRIVGGDLPSLKAAAVTALQQLQGRMTP